MDLIIIFKQRKESYPEELAPEIHAACTSYELEDGAKDWMDREEAEAKEDPEIVAVRRFRFKFTDNLRKEVRHALLHDHVIQTPSQGVEPEK